MKGKLLLGIGAAIGYVLGARAGRDSYEAMKAQADALWHDPRVQDKVAEASQAVREHAPEVPAKLADAASAVKSKVSGSESDSLPPVDTSAPVPAEPAGSEIPPLGETPPYSQPGQS